MIYTNKSEKFSPRIWANASIRLRFPSPSYLFKHVYFYPYPVLLLAVPSLSEFLFLVLVFSLVFALKPVEDSSNHVLLLLAWVSGSWSNEGRNWLADTCIPRVQFPKAALTFGLTLTSSLLMRIVSNIKQWDPGRVVGLVGQKGTFVKQEFVSIAVAGKVL